MKKIKSTAAIALIMLALLGISGCDWLVGSLVGGNAVNVFAEGSTAEFWKSGFTSESLEGAVITLTNIDDPSFSTTTSVDSEGYFSVGGLEAGRYRVTGSKNEWVFVPREVFIGGTFATIPDMYAYPASQAGDVNVILSWTEKSYDLDLLATVGGVDRVATGATLVGTPAGRSNPTPVENYVGNGITLELERDVQITTASDVPRVEAMKLKSQSTVGFPAAPLEIRFYADYFNSGTPGSTSGQNGDDSLTGLLDGSPGEHEPAYAQMHVMFGDEWFGTWTIPINSFEETLHILNIDVVDNAGPDNITVSSAGNYGDDIYRSIR